MAQERAKATQALCTEHGFAVPLAWGEVLRGAALVAQGAWVDGLAQMRQGLAAYRAIARLPWLLFLGLLAELVRHAGKVAQGFGTSQIGLAQFLPHFGHGLQRLLRWLQNGVALLKVAATGLPALPFAFFVPAVRCSCIAFA